MSRRPSLKYSYKPQTAPRPAKLEDLGSFDYNAFPNVKGINEFRADINGQEYLVFQVDDTWYKAPLNQEEQSYDTPDINVFENQSGLDAINKNNNFNKPLNVGVDDYAPFNANELPTDESNLGLEQEGIGFSKEEGIAPTHLENIHEHNRNLTYTDNLSIKFMDNDLVEVFTEDNVDQQIVVQPDGREMLVETIADYPVGALDNFLIKEGDPQYEPGKRNWRIPIAAENYEPDPKNPLQTKVTLSRNSGVGDYIEDAIVEPVLQGIRATEPEVYKRLSDWADGQITKFREKLGIQLYGTNELISKLYTAQRLGHKSQDVMDVFEKTGLLLPNDLVDILDSIVTTSREGRTNIEVLKNGPEHINQIPASNKILKTDAPEGKPVRYSIKDMKKEDRQRMVNSGRAGGSIDKDPVAWRHAAKEIEPYHEILDYGAGKNARQTKKYQAEGFNVNAWDLPENQATTLHDPQALRKRYDYVVASNVINVQPNISSVKNVLDEIYSVVNPGGKVVLNFPSSPRNSNLTPAGLEKMLNRIFEGVRKVDGTTSSPVFEARRRVSGTRSTAEVAAMLDKNHDLDLKNDLEVENYAVAQAVNDIVRLLEDPTFRLNDQLEWYGEEIADAMDIVSLESGMQIIKEKPEYEILLKTLLGITSQGLKPAVQYPYAVDLTKHFIKTGKFRYGKNNSGNAILKAKNNDGQLNTVGFLPATIIALNAKRIETLIEQFGLQGAMDWLLTPKTGYEIKDWSASNGLPIPGHIKKNKSTLEKTYYGANIFGPKIGRYTVGIYGFDGEAVYDLWMTRQWRRWTGGMFGVDKKGEKFIREAPEGKEIEIMDRVTDRVVKIISKELNYPFTRHQVQAMYWELEKVLWESLGQTPELSVNYKNAAMIRAERLGYADEYATSQSLRDAVKAKVRDYYRTSKAVKSIEEGVKAGRVRKILKKRYSFKVKSFTDLENADPLEAPIYYPQLTKQVKRLLEDKVKVNGYKLISILHGLNVPKSELRLINLTGYIQDNNLGYATIDMQKILDFVLSKNLIVQKDTFYTPVDDNRSSFVEVGLDSPDRIKTRAFTIESQNGEDIAAGTISIHKNDKNENIAVIEKITTDGIESNIRTATLEILNQAKSMDADFIYLHDKLFSGTGLIKDVLVKTLGKNNIVKNFPAIEDLTVKNYRMDHQPSEDGPRASNLLEGDISPSDIYETPQYYIGGRPDSDYSYLEAGVQRGAIYREMIGFMNKIKSIRNNPDAEILIHRSSPTQELNSGDWVTPSKTYAYIHGLRNQTQIDLGEKDFPVHSYTVKAGDIRWDGQQLEEWGYFPDIGKPLVLKNTYKKPKKRFSMKISDDTTPPPKEVYVDKTDTDIPTWKKDALTITRNNLNNIKKTGGFLKDLLEVIDTRLKLIAPNLESKLRKFEMELGAQTNEYLLKLAEFKDKVLDKLPKEKRLQLELALVNADESMVIDIINDLPDQIAINAFQAIEDYREMLDEIHERSLNTGYDIGFRNYYFPRRVKDLDGLLTVLNKNNPKSSGVITQAISEKERTLGRRLDDDERAGFISNMIRGFNVIAGKPGNLKDRRIEHIDMEMYKNYYEDFLTANERYLTGMVRTIKRQEFFGKGDDNVDDIGGAVARWMGQPGSQEELVKKKLQESDKPLTIKEVQEQTKILEPNVRRILGQGTKKGVFERVDRGVYTIQTEDGRDVAYIESGDALDVLPKLVQQGKKYDMVFLDPAYFSRALIGGNRGIKDYEFMYPPEFKKAVESVSALLKDDDSHCYLMLSGAPTAQKDMLPYLQAMDDFGFKVVGEGEWKKLFKNGKPVTNVRGKEAAAERIFLFTKSGNARRGEVSEGPSLYHETDLQSARNLVAGSQIIAGLNVSTDMNLAIGQTGKGVIIEFDEDVIASKFKGTGAGYPIKDPIIKPATDFLEKFGGGAKEFRIRENVRTEGIESVKRIYIKDGTAMDKVSEKMYKNFFDFEEGKNGMLIGTPKNRKDLPDETLNNLNFRFVRPNIRQSYQTEKAPELLDALIRNSTLEGESVLDPFAGSGVTGEQAIKSGRPVTLIEKSEKAIEEHILPKIRKATSELPDAPVDMEKPIIPPNISPDEQQQIIDILRARFNYRAGWGYISPLKNILYAMTMGKITSALTQLGDLAWSFHSAGFTPTTKAIFQTLVRKNILTKEDLGIERIAAEFNRVDKTGKALDFIFKAVGLDAMDRLGKETLVQAEYDKMRKQAKIISTGKSNFVLDEQKKRNFYVKLLQTFESEKIADQVIVDLAEGKMSEDIKFLMFCRLCDVQPVTQSQVPLKYLDSPNGRIGYQLKTFTLKQFDNYRRTGTIRMSNGLSLMHEGRKQKEEGEKANNKTKIEDGKRLIREGRKEYLSAFGSLVRLLAIFFATDTAANVVKDYVMGREVDLEDYAIDGIFRLFGFSRYIIYTGKREGYGRALLEQFIPFGLFISLEGKAERDLAELYKVWKGEKEWSGTYFETPNIVPVADWATLGLNAFDKIAGTDTASQVPLGKTYYWWYGGGKVKQLERNIKTIADASKEGIKVYDTYEKILDAERHLNRNLADLQSMHVITDRDRKTDITSFYNNIYNELKNRKAGLEGQAMDIYSAEDLDLISKVLQRMLDIGLIKTQKAANKKFDDLLYKYVRSEEDKEQKRQEEGLKFKELYEEAN